jgi:hypothetical protein
MSDFIFLHDKRLLVLTKVYKRKKKTHQRASMDGSYQQTYTRACKCLAFGKNMCKPSQHDPENGIDVPWYLLLIAVLLILIMYYKSR